jgi:hypothetical protein
MPARKAKKNAPSPRQLAKNLDSDAVKLASLVGIEDAIDRLIARHPNVDEFTLRKLGSSKDKATRKYVTTNPNSPKEVLLDLASQFPEELLANPIFDLLLLENPNLLEEMPLSTLRSLLKRDICPNAFLTWVGNIEDKGVQLSLAMNADTPKSVLKKLTGVENNEVAEAARLHVSLSGKVEDDWEKIFNDAVITAVKCRKRTAKQEALKLALLSLFVELPLRLNKGVMLIPNAGRVLAKLMFTPSVKLTILAQSDDRITREALASNQNTPIRILKKLAQDKSRSVSSAVLDNMNASDALRITWLKHSISDNISGIVGDGTYWNRARAAKKVNSVNLIKELAKTEDSAILTGLASNPNTPVEMLEQLANSGQWNVDCCVAANPNTPVDMLKQLAEENDTLLNYVIADNPNWPLSVLERITPDADAVYVMRRVSEHQNASEKLRIRLAGHIGSKPTDSINEKDNTWVATNPYIPDIVFERWIVYVAKSLDRNYDNRYERLLKALLGNPKLSTEIIERLLENKSKTIRVYILRNHKTPSDILKNYVSDKKHEVRQSVAVNTNTPIDVIKTLAKDKNRDVRWSVACNPSASPEILDLLANDKYWRIRWMVAKNLGTPARVLEQLAADSRDAVRVAVAENPNTPIRILQQLAVDDWNVRRGVAGNISTPIRLIQQLALDEEDWVRRAIARNIKLQPATLEMMAKDKDASVRRAVANNSCTTPQVIEYLSMDRDRHVRRAAEERLSGSDYTYSYERLNQLLFTDITDLDLLNDIHYSEKIDERMRRKLKKLLPEYLVAACCKPSRPSLSRLLAFMCIKAPPSALAKYYRSLDWKERCAIALNLKTPLNTIEKLMNDGNRIVRAAASSRGDNGRKSP